MDSERPMPAPLVDRRAALSASAGLALAAVTAPPAAASRKQQQKSKKKKPPASPPLAFCQTGWRMCTKCGEMVFSPKLKPSGACAAGGKHAPNRRYNFVLFNYDSQATRTPASANRCKKCGALGQFFSSDTTRCPAGGGHESTGMRFGLGQHDPYAGVTDDGWDFCAYCSAVYNIYSSNNRCQTSTNSNRTHLRTHHVLSVVKIW